MGWAIADGRLEVLRGRQGRAGFTGLSLSTFCDLVWTEIWDDASPMGDRNEYRRIMRELFIDGKDPHLIWYTDAKGRKQRLSSTPSSPDAPIPQDAMAQAKAMRDQMLAAAAERAKKAASDDPS